MEANLSCSLWLPALKCLTIDHSAASRAQSSNSLSQGIDPLKILRQCKWKNGTWMITIVVVGRRRPSAMNDRHSHSPAVAMAVGREARRPKVSLQFAQHQGETMAGLILLRRICFMIFFTLLWKLKGKKKLDIYNYKAWVDLTFSIIILSLNVTPILCESYLIRV